MFKKMAVAAVLVASSMVAFAGTPTAVNNSAGTVVYGTEQALSIEKDTSSGNRVKVKYSSGYQYVGDDAAWSRYAALKAGMTKPVDSPTSTSGLSYDIAKVNVISCSGGTTSVNWPNVGIGDSISDSCSMFNAAKSAAN